MTVSKLERAIDAALTLQQEGDLEGAARAFLAAQPLAPKDHRLSDEAGNIFLYALERPLDAIPCFEKALAIFPEGEPTTAMWIKLGLAHSLAGHDERALHALSTAGKQDPTNVNCFVEFGKHHLSQGRYQDAFEYFQTAHAHFHMQQQFGSVLGGGGMNLSLIHI